MAYEPPPQDKESLPEETGPADRYSSEAVRPRASADVPSPQKADPGDYATLPRSYLNVVTKSRPETYEAEMPGAGWGKTLLGVAIVTLVSFGIKIFLAPYTLAALEESKRYLASQGRDPNVDPLRTGFQWAEALTSPLMALLVPVTFFAGAGLLYALSRAVRDKAAGPGASFMTHAYLLSLSYTPLHTLSSLLNIFSVFQAVSCIASIVALALTIYQLYNAGVSMQASQKLDAGKAQMVAFMPWVVGILLIVVISVLAVVSLGASILR